MFVCVNICVTEHGISPCGHKCEWVSVFVLPTVPSTVNQMINVYASL